MLCPPAICYNGCYPLRKGLSQLKTVQAIVEDNQIILLEAVPLRAGQRLLITFLNDPESQFWAEASQNSLEVIWDNEEDDIYAQAIAYSIPGD
ncbi:MAG TPA: hypothetical protein PLD25_06305 [Chloroflexota bacterium]|nr:hypothetical protein [Chloroflexota bacterium]